MIDKSFIDNNCIYPDFPKPGIKFVDIFPCLEKEPLMLQMRDIKFEGIVLVPEARGFLFYDLISLNPNTAVVPLRKAGKMPGHCYEISIEKEYGSDYLYLQVDALNRAVTKLERVFGTFIPVMVFDDILAVGGTALGIINKMRDLRVCNSVGYDYHLVVDSAVFYMELEALEGRKLLESNGVKVQSVIKY